MGFVKDSDINEIGKARGAGHLYHFSQNPGTNRLVATYVDYYTGRGVIKESRDQGVTWYEVGDTGKSKQIATRKGEVTYSVGERGVGTYDVLRGNTSEEVRDSPITGIAVPSPEQGAYFGQVSAGQGSGGFAFYNHAERRVYGGTPGRGLSGFWGSEENGGLPNGMHIVWIFVDPFFEPINYQVLAYWTGRGWAEVNPRPQTGSYYPTPLAFEQLVGGSGFEGWQNSRSSRAGVSYRVGRPSPSFFKPADHWQGGQNAAPVYIPNLGSLNSEAYRTILSTPNGLEDDVNFTRGAIFGYVAGRLTFGLMEPGFGFAWAQGFVHNVDYGGPEINEELESSPRQRKFLGNIAAYYRARLWMPYSLGIFGMGVIANLTSDPPGCQSLYWIYDKEPGRLPRAVKAEDGKYTSRTDVQKSQPVKTGGKYTRW